MKILQIFPTTKQKSDLKTFRKMLFQQTRILQGWFSLSLSLGCPENSLGPSKQKGKGLEFPICTLGSLNAFLLMAYT